MLKYNNLFGIFLILSGFILFGYLGLFITESIEDLMFLITGVYSTIIVIWGIILIENKKKMEKKND